MYRRIQDLREDRNMMQTQMGRILSCSQNIYSRYERGAANIPTEALIKLADFHNVSVDDLLVHTKNPHTAR